MENRLVASKNFAHESAIFCITIDDFQANELSLIVDSVFGPENSIGTVAIRSNPSGRPVPSGFAQAHEYAIFARKTSSATLGAFPRSADQLKRYKEIDKHGKYMWELFRKRGSESLREDRETMYYPLFCDGTSIRIPRMDWDEGARIWIQREEPTANEVVYWPIDEEGVHRRWRWGPERVKLDYTQIRIGKNDGVETVYYKYRPKGDTVLPMTVWTEAKYSATEHGTDILKQLFGASNAFDYPKSVYAVFDCIQLAIGSSKNCMVLDYFAGSGTTGQAVLNLCRSGKLEIGYILVEQGPYFDTVIKPRMQKVVYSADWKAGKPTAPATGISHAFKVLKLESYEDTVNNLNLTRAPAQTDLLALLPPKEHDAYLMGYMLDVESRGSLLSVEDFKKPFDYRLKIAVDSAGAWAEQSVDLVETFNYLIGLTVKSIDMQWKQGFVTVEGTLPSGERALILWRDCEKVDYEGLQKLCDRLAINPGDREYDVIYINGDHTLPSVLERDASEGGESLTVKLRQIESAFLSAMFDVADL
ncbi:MAG: DNA methyltransferase [Hyphomonadaceae bacterium]